MKQQSTVPRILAIFFGTPCTFATSVCKFWSVSDKYTGDNAGDLKHLSMDKARSENNRSDSEAIFTHGNTFLIIAISHKRLLRSTPGEP